MDWTPTPDYQRIAEANRLFYQKNAQIYDTTETCVTNPIFQKQLQDMLDEALAIIGKPLSEISALDACGGTGNVGLKLANRGVSVTLADVSPDQLEIFRTKCQKQGIQAQTHCGDIAAFLDQSKEQYDFIVFSSALHHLADYHSVLALAYDALRPGGVLMTLYDPTLVSKRSLGTRCLLSFDYLCFKVREQWTDVPAGLARRLKRKLRPRATPQAEIPDDSIGFLAEYHLGKGIDDLDLIQRLKNRGAELLWHKREGGGRHQFTRKLVAMLGDATDFKTLFRKPR
jgi:ubiquinone/menaquinone biosynthesis C-methylase UbiE